MNKTPQEIVEYRGFQIHRKSKSKWRVKFEGRGYYFDDHVSLEEAKERCDRIAEQSIMGRLFVMSSEVEAIIRKYNMTEEEVGSAFSKVKIEFERSPRWSNMASLFNQE